MEDDLPNDWEHPKWNVESRVHNWRNYVSSDVQRIWETFTPEQKHFLAVLFQDMANNEEWD